MNSDEARISAEALRRHAENLRAIEAEIRAGDRPGDDLLTLTCVGSAARFAEVAASQYEAQGPGQTGEGDET